MKVELRQTASNHDSGEMRCYTCEELFYVGAVTCWAVGEDNTLMGDVCPLCLQRGSEHMQELLDSKAWWSSLEADQDERIAAEGISDCPTLDELLAAEAYYVTPRFGTGEEYEEARNRGET